MKRYLIGAAFGAVLMGCASAPAAAPDTPSTTIECSGFAGGCGSVFWIERGASRCAVPVNHQGDPVGIDCQWPS